MKQDINIRKHACNTSALRSKVHTLSRHHNQMSGEPLTRTTDLNLHDLHKHFPSKKMFYICSFRVRHLFSADT